MVDVKKKNNKRHEKKVVEMKVYIYEVSFKDKELKKHIYNKTDIRFYSIGIYFKYGINSGRFLNKFFLSKHSIGFVCCFELKNSQVLTILKHFLIISERIDFNFFPEIKKLSVTAINEVIKNIKNECIRL